MSFRGLLALALLVAAAGAERVAYYGWRATLALDMSREGLPAAKIGMAFSAMQLATVVCSSLGAALALGIGARWSALAGLGLSLLGFVSLTAHGPLLFRGMLVMAGAAVFRACVYGTAAAAFARTDGGPGAVARRACSALQAWARSTRS